jgi:hypothetical protein
MIDDYTDIINELNIELQKIGANIFIIYNNLKNENAPINEIISKISSYIQLFELLGIMFTSLDKRQIEYLLELEDESLHLEGFITTRDLEIINNLSQKYDLFSLDYSKKYILSNEQDIKNIEDKLGLKAGTLSTLDLDRGTNV